MAHELDFSPALNRHSVFSVREDMWHRLGAVIADAPDFETAMRISGADYTVEKRPIMFQTSDGPAFAEGSFAVVRSDRETCLGIVSDRYGCVQNRTQFQPLEALLDAGLATLETGGVLRDGRQAWMLAKLKLDLQGPGGDVILPYVLATTRHDGGGNAETRATATRVVCANTLRVAQASGRGYKVRHVGDAEGKVTAQAQALFASLGESFRVAGEMWSRMRAFKLTREAFVSSVLDTLAPLPVADRAETMTKAGFERAHDRAETARDRLTALWTGGAGHTGDMSAWEAYNAAVELVDHETELLRRFRGDRVEAEVSGWTSQAKADVESALMAIVNAR